MIDSFPQYQRFCNPERDPQSRYQDEAFLLAAVGVDSATLPFDTTRVSFATRDP
ncbi:hypothetical protein CEP52_004242 [Fusarium oligoseptatum]|uniref:Uncharacterized protein n=1 Tax=Fusarium oligoseptatum TaxID=2604345 RepID=A0A428U4H6_9HYPO|nr:hypothetical protein CEP52_004242 [Fusarium oligoseptatum]